MSDSRDIIQAALDILSGDSQEARVLVQRRGGNAIMWYCRVTGLGSRGHDATITISDVRADADGPVHPGHLLLNVEDILDITPIQGS